MTSYIDPRGKLFAHIDRLAQVQNNLHPPPVNVEIDLSNRCQLGCEFCHFAYTHSRGPHAQGDATLGDLLDTKLAMNVVRELSRFGVRSITWSGGGEPTLHSDLEHILSETFVDQGMYTNGLIDQATAKLLKDRLTWVYVSLDCYNRAEYARVKRVDKFDDAVQGIRWLVEAAGNATVGLGALVSADTAHLINDMLILARDLGVDYVQYRPVVRYDHTRPNELVEDTGWIGEVIEVLSRIANEPDVIVDLPRFEMYGNWQGHSYDTCWWSALQAVITPDGRVWACANKRGHGPALLGDLTCHSFAYIWRHAPVQVVDEHCRVMCRGHIPNLMLDDIMRERQHANFI